MTEEDEIRILADARDGKLPHRVDRTSDYDLTTFGVLLGLGCLAGYSDASQDGGAWINVNITRKGETLLAKLLPTSRSRGSAREVPPPAEATTRPVQILISHSSEDRDVYEPLVELLRSALTLQSEEVRCTSLSGFRLPGGEDGDEILRSEAVNVPVFIGLISPASLRSAYVTLELGARWGARKRLFLVLVPGQRPEGLPAPLRRLTAHECIEEGHLHQLVNEVASVLRRKCESPAAYVRFIQAMQSATPRAPEAPPSTSRGAEGSAGGALRAEAEVGSGRGGEEDADGLCNEDVEVLRLIANAEEYFYDSRRLAGAMKMHETRVRHHLDRLADLQMVHELLSSIEPTRYGLRRRGREVAVERGLV